MIHSVKIANEADIARARLASRSVAEQIGFDGVETHSIVTSVSELASNIYYHAGTGTVEIKRIEIDGIVGIEVTARDQGPGIACVITALQDGFSTAGGLGGGLPGVNRLMHELEIDSKAHHETRVTARRFIVDRTFLGVDCGDDWEIIGAEEPFGRLRMKRVGDTYLFRSTDHGYPTSARSTRDTA